MEKIIEYFQYDFVIYAFIVGVLVSFCSAILGAIIVTKKISFIGDSLSHVSFAMTTVAMVSGLSGDIFLSLLLTVLISYFLFKNKEDSRLPNDALLAVVSIFSLSFGYMYMNLFSKRSNVSGDVCGFLFGSTSILTLTIDEVISCCILSIAVIVFFVAFYNKIYAVTFDESFAAVSGTNVKLYKLFSVLLIDVIIVLATNLVGALLVSALIVLPTLSGILLTKSFKSLIIVSSIISVLGAFSGLLISIIFGTPVGCTIVMIDTVIFVICRIIKFRDV